MEEKNFFEKLREILKNNEIFYTMLGPIIAFLYELIKSYIFSFRYGISNKFIEINTKEILVNFLVIFIFSLFPLFVLYALNSIAYTKKEDKKKLRLTSKNDEKSNIDKKYTINLMEYLNYFENDFLKYVENLNIPKISDNEIKKIMGDNELYIINFNYTTYLKEYLETNKHFNYKDMLNINGEIKTDLVIFGIDEIQIQNNHRKKELEKFVKSKKGQKDWKLLIKNCEITDFEEIIFFGHSLADADYSTLKEIFDYFNIKDNENIKLIFKTKDKFYNNHKKEIEHFMARYLGKNHKNVMDKIFCIEIV